MRSFLKYFLASLLGCTIPFFFAFIFFISFIGIMLSPDEPQVKIRQNSILIMKLDKPIQDRYPEMSFSFGNFMSEDVSGLNNILSGIEKAKEDKNIRGIYLDLSHIPAGYATIDEIREALIDFKKSGKFVITYCEYLTNTSYYLASVSDKIYMNPEGELFVFGLSMESLFFKNAFEKIGLKAQVIKHGEYKSAPETFTGTKMSEENKIQLTALSQSIWDNIVDNISKERKISKKKINDVLDNLLLVSAEDAVNYKFIDKLMYKDELISILKEKSNIQEEDHLRMVSLNNYSLNSRKHFIKYRKRPKIAVIYASGKIVPGEGTDDNIGADRISREIRKARRDNSVKSIVLRINSPGGSALASEVIWREMDVAKKIKPVVVSFGDVAASGGYYIACPANAIITGKNTITGSIGVYGIVLNAKELFNEHLGITSDIVKTNKYSDFASPFRSLTKQEEMFLQRSVEDVYDTFVSHVASGRSMSKEKVNGIAQGRIWSGIHAINNGLADKTGGLSEAIETAADLSEVQDYIVKELPEFEAPFKRMFSKISEEYEMFIVKKFLGSDYEVIKELKNIEQFNGIQAIMPYKINLH